MKRIFREHWPFSLPMVLLAVLLTVALCLPAESAQAASWGLSFRTQGQAPVGNADSAHLRKYDAAFVGNAEEKTLYLTFDAGYENGYTAKILDVLQAHNIQATFFVVGNFVKQNPELVRRMRAEGHTVGNHTYHHYDMSKLSDLQSFRAELELLEQAYREATGEELPKYYRPPRGVYSEENLKMAQSLGYKTVFWSLAYVDWLTDAQPTAEQAFSKLLPRIHSGAVLLLHSTSKTNAEILDELLTRYEAAGYTFAPIERLFA